MWARCVLSVALLSSALGLTVGSNEKEPAPRFSATLTTGKGLILLAVDVGESKKTVKKYLEQHPRDCKIALMEDTNLAAMYQATVYPIYALSHLRGD